MTLNRVVAIIATLASLGLAIVPVIGNFDWTSTAGVLAGIAGILTVTVKWLDGWQKHESREHFELAVPPIPDEGDKGAP